MTLKTRLILLVLITVVGVVSLIGYSLFQISNVYYKTNFANKYTIPSILLLDRASTSLYMARVRLHFHVLNFDPNENGKITEDIYSAAADVDNALNAYETDGCGGSTCIASPEDRESLGQIRSAWQDYTKLIPPILAASQREMEGLDSARDLLNKARPVAIRASDHFRARMLDTATKAELASSAAQREINETYVLQIIGGVITLSILTVSKLLFGKYIFAEIGGEPATVKKVAIALADGDIREPIELRQGDASSILFHMNKVLIGAVALIRRAEYVGQGDFTSPVPLSSSRDRFGHAIRDMVRMLELNQLKLMESRDELIEQGKLASLGSLVAGVAHELNSPIGSSLTIASTMKDQAENFQTKIAGNSIRRDDLTEFAESMKTASTLLEQILWRTSDLIKNFKQVATDQVHDTRRNFDLAVTIDQTLATLRAFHARSKVEIISEISGDIPLQGYPGALSQVVTNLVNNAVVHGFDHGAPGEVSLSVRAATSGSIAVFVTDNGRGMPEAIAKRVFEPFFTTRMGNGGTGLGLAIVRNIVTGTLGGKIALHSKPGQGTKVILTLPRIAPIHETYQAAHYVN
jgi:signal transduction histidine kinase